MDFSDISALEPFSLLAGPASTVCDQRPQWDSFEESPEKLQHRLRGMQELVC
jgi:hypothetical protein